MMSASPGAEDSFELRMAVNVDAETRDSIDDPEKVEIIMSKTKQQQADFNFSSLWRKPRLSRRRLACSTGHQMHHVKLDSPVVADGEAEPFTPDGKTTKGQNTKDRESFETMVSPHLSELDESRDVIPVIMKREGWNFSRELPQGYDESISQYSSALIRKEVSHKIFLTPSPGKSRTTPRSSRGSATGLMSEDQDSDEVFTLIRCNGFKSRLSSHSKKSHPNLRESGTSDFVPLCRGGQKAEEANTAKRDMLQQVEVYDGDYLTNDAVLSSLSEDSCNSQRNHFNSHDPAADKSKMIDCKGSNGEAGDELLTGSSFSDRIKFFQSKATESNTKNNINKSFQRNQPPSQATVSTAEAKSSTKTDTEGTERKQHVIKQSTTVQVNESQQLTESYEKNVLRSKEHFEATLKRMSGIQPVRENGNDANMLSGRALSASQQKECENKSESPSARTNANLFGGTSGQRRMTNGYSQGCESSEKSSSHIDIDPSNNRNKNRHSNDDNSEYLNGDFECDDGVRRSTIVSRKKVGSSPRKLSKSMSVLERSKFFDRPKASVINTSQCTRLLPAPHFSKPTMTCDKCGSEIKVPKDVEKSFWKITEKETHREIRRSLFWESNDAEIDMPIEDEDNSDDDSTAVCDRRRTLKSAPREKKVTPKNSTSISDENKETYMNVFVEPSQKFSVMERLKRFERTSLNRKFNCGSGESNRILISKTMIEDKSFQQSHATEKADLSQSREKVDDHPTVVAIENDFLATDDTSGFYSASESSRQVVCPPSDQTPYYMKKRRQETGDINEDSSVESSIQKNVSQWKQKNSKTKQITCSATQQNSKPKTVVGIQKRNIVEVGGALACKIDARVLGENESTKENSTRIGNCQESPLKRGNATTKNEMNQLPDSMICSSISERVAIFQRSSTSTKKWRPSLQKATNRKSTDRWSHSESRQSSRRSSLSLQDVVENRKTSEERRKPFTCESIEGAQTQYITVETNENVRPSDLFRKLAESVEPAPPPSPLIHRRGFASLASRSSTSQPSKFQNLRCF
ncbi:hypothetical protein IV203_031660 [Nitzschia inconspicua]|uniref:Uncharacterized protein n=1 Tax=Nitzschia inconspicua TaxID=303405 RepID=A0A9K3LVM0_9STRA|nr:hypothetical protein IV203_031660 [Nitzschia inconspicua]